MESLSLPLEDGSVLLDSTPLSEAEVGGTGVASGSDIDSMSSEGARLVYEREDQIKPDFSSLADELLNEEDGNRIKSLSEEMAASILDLQNKLRAVGAFNPHASDRLKDTDKRFHEAADELSDLKRRAQKAEKAFMDVQQDRYTRFMEAFDVVKDRVDGIYKSICYQPGAQAALYPDNITDPYLGAIIYECIPPGKRFLPMRDLSGGEKTIAALALVFALRSFRHPPFFVLDEIDAALDKTNIHKVARYIKSECQRGNFQCIVISLKLGLYEHADALIGVARQVCLLCLSVGSGGGITLYMYH
jgi:structural maintenance of chromosome 1